MSATATATQVPGRIDVHMHMLPAFFREAMLAAGRWPTIKGGFPAWSIENTLGVMDRHGIATGILSISQPGVHFGDTAAAAKLARACNDYAAEVIALHRGRFGAFATLPMPDVEAAATELRYALDTLNLDGVCLLASYGEFYLGDERFEPLLALLHEREAVVFVHPNLHPAARMANPGLPPLALEFPFDTTRAALQLIHRRIVQRYSGIRFVLAHAGGTLPYLAWRLEMATLMDPEATALSVVEIREGLRHFWYDTALSTGKASLLALAQVARPDQVVFGSDWPFGPESVVAASCASLSETQAFTHAQIQKIQRDNTIRLFPRFA